jgi:hypothetical protein
MVTFTHITLEAIVEHDDEIGNYEVVDRVKRRIEGISTVTIDSIQVVQIGTLGAVKNAA